MNTAPTPTESLACPDCGGSGYCGPNECRACDATGERDELPCAECSEILMVREIACLCGTPARALCAACAADPGLHLIGCEPAAIEAA